MIGYVINELSQKNRIVRMRNYREFLGVGSWELRGPMCWPTVPLIHLKKKSRFLQEILDFDSSSIQEQENNKKKIKLKKYVLEKLSALSVSFSC